MIKKLVFIAILAIATNYTQAQSKDSAAVNAAVELLRKSMIDPDKAALEKLTSHLLSYGHSSGKIEDQAAFIDALVGAKSDFVTIDFTNQTVAIAGNTAIVRHNLSATTNDNGSPGTVKLHVLLVWEKQKGAWKLLARQAVKLP